MKQSPSDYVYKPQSKTCNLYAVQKNTENASESTSQNRTAFSILDVPCELKYKS